MAIPIRRREVALLTEAYASRREEIRRRLQAFSSVPRDEYFYELAYCLLTPQTSAASAEQVVEELKSRDYYGRGFNPERILRSRRHYIRFHRTKARRLAGLRTVFGSVQRMLEQETSPRNAREWLVEHINGLGYKEATHFLRNIGRNGGLAILDRHILRRLHRIGVIREVPSSLTRARYLEIEHRFAQFAERIGIPVDELDLVFWSLATGIIRK
jgi:N-glycosylase/DNA lyase